MKSWDRKVDADNPTKGLAGAVIKITGVDNSFTGTYITDNGGYLTEVPWDTMPIGSYIAEEVTPPEGFSLSPDAGKVKQSFHWDGKSDVSLVFENDAKVKIQLIKLDDSNNPLPGAVFNILRDGQIIGTEATQADGSMVRSFPVCGKCAVQRDCKVRPVERYKRAQPPGTVQYIGIAKDEQERLLRLDGAKISLLEKYNFTERDAWELCNRAGLLSPVYGFTDRGGCWFCPNAKRVELRHLYDHHPDLWARMLELQAIPGKATEKFNRTQRFSDIDAIFREEDRQALRTAA